MTCWGSECRRKAHSRSRAVLVEAKSKSAGFCKMEGANDPEVKQFGGRRISGQRFDVEHFRIDPSVLLAWPIH